MYTNLKDTEMTAIGTCLQASFCATPEEVIDLIGAAKIHNGRVCYEWKKESFHGAVVTIYLMNSEGEEIYPHKFYRFSIGAFDSMVGQDVQESIVLDLCELRNRQVSDGM